MLAVKKKPQDGSVEMNLPVGSFLILEVDGVVYSVGFTGKHRHKREAPQSPFDDTSAVTKPETIGKLRMVKEEPPEKKWTPTEGSPASESLGKKIHAARIASGMEMNEFAEHGGVSKSKVYSLEHGHFVHLTDLTVAALKAWDITVPNKRSTLWPK